MQFERSPATLLMMSKGQIKIKIRSHISYTVTGRSTDSDEIGKGNITTKIIVVMTATTLHKGRTEYGVTGQTK